MRLYGKVERMIDALHYFTTNEWIFRSTALPKLYDELNPEDKHVINLWKNINYKKCKNLDI